MPISLPKALDRKIEKQVRNGDYASKSEYLRELAREDLDRTETELERKKHSKFYTKLDRDLFESIKQYKQGKFYGPFKTAEDGIKFLHSRRPKLNRRAIKK